MSRRRATTGTAPKKGRGTVLRGVTEEQGRDAAVKLLDRTGREKALARLTDIDKVLANADDPHLYVMASWIDAWTYRDPCVGGRPLAHPTWFLQLFNQCLPIFGSIAATEIALREPILLKEILRIAAKHLPAGAVMPDTAPTRYQHQYFMRRLEPHLDKYVTAQAELGALRAREVGLADPARASFSRPDRMHVASADGKVFNSPLSTLETQRVNKRTGEILYIRQDPARCQHREGGSSDVVYGTKYAIISVRSPMSGSRIIIGVQHVPGGDGRGEAGAFVDLAVASALRLPGLVAFNADGAMRGTHITQIQTQTGIQVISPPRPRAVKHGGTTIQHKGHATKPLPTSKSQRNAFNGCDGHDLWAGGGAVLERTITADATIHFNVVDDGQIKRERKRNGEWNIRVLQRLVCSHTGETHEWWESRTPTKEDEKAGFNRAEYLRTTAITNPDYKRRYGMRADAESLNAQLEFAFRHNRLPVWGTPRQTVVIVGAAMAHNSWALRTWHQEVARQHAPPGHAA